MLTSWLTLAALAAATAAASVTITRTKITAPLRAWVQGRSEWLGALISCPYCLSHWLGAVAVGVYRPRVTDGLLLLDLGVAWLALVAACAVVVGAITRGIAPAPAAAPAAAPTGSLHPRAQGGVKW